MLLRTTDPFRDLDRLAQQVFGTVSRPAVMPMDAWREGDRFVIEFDLPGVAKDSIDLDVERNVLTVRAERIARSGRLGAARIRASARDLQSPARAGGQPRSRADRGGLRRRCAAPRRPGRREGEAPQDRGRARCGRRSGAGCDQRLSAALTGAQLLGGS